MAQVRLVRRTGKIVANPKPAVDAMSAAIVKLMRDRIHSGVDAHGAKFTRYSSLYTEQLAATGVAGEVRISRTDSLVRDLRVLRVELAGAVATIVFGVGSGASTSTPRPPPWVFSPKKTPAQRARALEEWKAAPKKPGRSLPHTQLLEQLAAGGVGRPGRDILGLTTEDRRAIVRLIEKASIFRST